MSRAIRVVAIVMLLVLAPGCAPGGAGALPPDVTPDLRGVVTSIDWSGDTQQSALVVWTDAPVVGPKAEYDAASVGLTNDTGYFRKAGDSYQSDSASAIVVGSVVEVWFTGAVAESYPVQATAKAIAVVGTYEGTLPTPAGLQAP